MLHDDVTGFRSNPEQISFVDINMSTWNVINSNRPTILGMNFEIGN